MTKPYVSWIVCVAMIAGCAQTPPAPPPAPPPPPPPVEPPPPPAPCAGIVQDKAASRNIAEKTIAPLLETGKEAQARAELEHALCLDPDNKQAQSFMRQITDDPVAWLGRESFAYTIKPSDSLSGVAAIYLKDKYLFYVLARYNNIAVPKQIAVGQTIRVPGKGPKPLQVRPGPSTDSTVAATTQPPDSNPPLSPAPPRPEAPAAPPAPSPSALAMREGAALEKSNPERALAAYQRADSLGEPGASAKMDAVKTQLVSTYSKAARTARTNQKLNDALAAWDHVLSIDPNNDAAKRERAQVVELKARYEDSTKKP